MIGWTSFQEDESWHDRGHWMSIQLRRALEIFPMQVWSEIIKERKDKILENIENLPILTQQAMNWNIVSCGALNNCHPKRKRGRPRTRW